MQQFSENFRQLQNHEINVYGPNFWVDTREGSFFLYQEVAGHVVNNIADLQEANNVNNGTMTSIPNNENNLSNWVGHADNFRHIQII